MSDQIRKAIEGLFSACLELSATGKYQAFFNWAPHVSKVSVDVYPGGTQFVEGVEVMQVYEASAYVDGRFAEYEGGVVGQLDRATAHISSLLEDSE